jgi:hypothetical protein
MPVKSESLSTKYATRLNGYLSRHKTAVADGKPLSELLFCAMVGVDYYPPEAVKNLTCKEQLNYYQRKQSKLVLANRVLAARGLQLKGHNYCTSFTFTADVDYAIARNETLAINAGIRNGVLMTGRKVHRGVWAKLTKSEAEHLVHGYK